jgi:hypothetical protein
MILNRGTITTDYLKSAACALALGGRLCDFDTDGQDPCYRRLTPGDRVVTTFNFHPQTTDDLPVKKIFAECRQLGYGQAVSADFPQRETLELIYGALRQRDRIHLKIKETFGYQPRPDGAVGITCSKLATALTVLGCRLAVCSLAATGKRVTIWFAPDSRIDSLIEAWDAWPDQALLAAAHPLYHLWNVLHCREALIDLSKRALIMGEVEQHGNKFILPVSVSDEQIKTTIKKLNS